MNRSKAIELIALALKKWNGAYYDESLESYILSELEEAGMKPPCVDGDKCQFLLRKYMDPSFYYWDEEFEKQHGEEYKKWSNRRKLSFKEFSDELNKNRKGRS